MSAGTPNPSIVGGLSEDVDDLLTGPGVTAVSPVGVGVMMGTDETAVVVGTPTASVSMGASFTDAIDEATDEASLFLQDGVAAFFDAAEDSADFVDDLVDDFLEDQFGPN